MTSGDCSLVIDRGGTFTIAFKLSDEFRNTVDLTNTVAEFLIMPDYDETPIIDIDSEGSQVVIDLDTAFVRINLTSTQTATLTAASYVFRFQIVSNGERDRWVRGPVIMKD
jgi:hypothetical protein